MDSVERDEATVRDRTPEVAHCYPRFLLENAVRVAVKKHSLRVDSYLDGCSRCS